MSHATAKDSVVSGGPRPVLESRPEALREHVLGAQRDSLARARWLLASGRYPESTRLSQRLLSLAEATAPVDSLGVAEIIDVLVEGLILDGAPDLEVSRDLAERSLKIREGILGPEHPDVARSLERLGDLLDHQDHKEAAIPMLERALMIQEKALGPENPEVARTLYTLGMAVRSSGDYHRARSLFERSLAIREKRLGPDGPEMGESLYGLANVIHETGDLGAALPLRERSVAILERALGPRHAKLARALNALGNLYREMGDYLKAKTVTERGLTIREAALRPDHPDVAGSLNNLANVLHDTGDYAAAKPLRERALGIWTKTYGPESHGAALATMNLATLIADMGDLVEARRLEEVAVTTMGKLDSPDLIPALYNLADVLHRLGDYDAERPVFERCVARAEKDFGPTSPWAALGLLGLANLARETGEGPDARRLYERVLAIREQSANRNDRDLATARADFARFLFMVHEDAEARSNYERALASFETSLGPTHPIVASTQLELARVLRADGDLERARALCAGAVEIEERVLGPDHPDLAHALKDLGVLDFELGQQAQAISEALRAELIRRDHVRLTARYLAEKQALGYAAVNPGGLGPAISALSQRPDRETVRRVFDSVVRSRSVVLDEMAARHQRVAEGAQPELASLRNRLMSASTRLANLFVRGPDQDHPERYRSLLDDARRSRDETDRALADAERRQGSQQEFEKSRLGYEEVARELPSGSALLAFLRYERIEPAGMGPGGPSRADRFGDTGSRKRTQAPETPSYLAFLLSAADAALLAIPLGEAQEIDSLISRWSRDIARPGYTASGPRRGEEADYRSRAGSLRGKIWDPIKRHLAGCRQVFVVPDGAVNLVSFAALPDTGAGYLVETGPTIYYLSSERDLVQNKSPGGGNCGLLAIGGPDFDAVATSSSLRANRETVPAGDSSLDGAAAPYRGSRSACAGFSELRFSLLPGTVREVREVASLWDRHGRRGGEAGCGASVLTGAKATETRFKSEAPGHGILHVATHGFFLGHCVPPPESTRSVTSLVQALPGEPTVVAGENPLLLSGLGLAGANKRGLAARDEDDGILTAEEIATLDLSGVRLAVLSACETGVGEVRGGEGVFGLRRAFQIAGAQTLIMSLWSVDDPTTRDWMRRFYEERFIRRSSTADAMRGASLSVLRERRARGQSTHPFYWGAFVAAGNWR